MKTYRNANWTKRDYECINVVACVSPVNPTSGYAEWVEAGEEILEGLTLLHSIGAATFYGYL